MAASDIVQPEIAVSFPQRTGSVHHDFGSPFGGLFDEEDERLNPRTRALEVVCTLVHLIVLETSKRCWIIGIISSLACLLVLLLLCDGRDEATTVTVRQSVTIHHKLSQPRYQ